MSSKEKFKTQKGVFDEKTLRVLFKLESEGYFEELKSPISIGKESNVFSAIRKDGTYVIIKVYRVNNADFNRMYKYISADPRFEGLSNQRRKVIYAWAQREYKNLIIASKAGADVPMPYAVRENVLVMELIGHDKDAAPRLKDAEPENAEKFCKEIIENLKKFYKAGLVHGDLSEFNILNYNEKPYIIDISHGTKADDSLSEELLERDIKNLERYFGKRGLKVDVHKILNEVKKNGI